MDDIRVFPLKMASRLARVSEWQASSWVRRGFITPSFGQALEPNKHYYFFSFRDVVALRVMGLLRHNHDLPLQVVGEVSNYLQENAQRPWSQLRFWVCGRKVRLPNSPERSAPECVTDTDLVELAPIAAEIEAAAAKCWQRNPDDIGKVERHRNIAHGAPVVKGTRIPVSTIVSLATAGLTTEEIIDAYPTLVPEDIHGVLRLTQDQRRVA